MQIKFDEVLIFQKLSEQERVILSILDYLDTQFLFIIICSNFVFSYFESLQFVAKYEIY